MTIKEYMRKVESAKMTPKDSDGASFTDAMMETIEIWSNDACVGGMAGASDAEQTPV